MNTSPTQLPSKKPIDAPTIASTSAPTRIVVVSAETFVDTSVAAPLPTEDMLGGEVDPDSVQVVQDPLNGVVSVNENGELVYTPNPEFQGTDQFTYSACDINGECVTFSVMLTVSQPPEEERNRREGLYALIALVLAPLICLCQEPLKRFYDHHFPSRRGGKTDDDPTATASSTGVPTSIAVDQPSTNQGNDDASSGENEA